MPSPEVVWWLTAHVPQMFASRSVNLVIATAALAAIAFCVMWRLGARHVHNAPPDHAPPRRFEVVVAGTFPDQLQTYSGSSASTPDGELIAWCGHRSSDLTTSGLVYMHLPLETLQILKCAGAGPDGFEYSSAVYDPASKTFYVFGGWGDGMPTNELFRLKLGGSPLSWEKVDAKGSKPSPRNGAPMVFDAPRLRLIVCGGDAGTQNNFRPVGDCWQFDLATSTWTSLAATGQPSPRWHAAMEIDPSRQKAYLFGGAGTGPFDATLYELDLPSNTWHALQTSGSPPPSLQGATFTFDASNRVLVVAGGLRHKPPGPATISQVWVYDPSSGQWDESDCGDDVRRRDHLGIYCSTTGEHLLIGGRVSTTIGNFYDRGLVVTRNVRLKVRPVNSASGR